MYVCIFSNIIEWVILKFKKSIKIKTIAPKPVRIYKISKHYKFKGIFFLNSIDYFNKIQLKMFIIQQFSFYRSENVYYKHAYYRYDLRGLCSWGSLKSPLNDRRFINRRNFQNEQVQSAEVIYNDAVHTQHSTADSTGNQTQR